MILIFSLYSNDSLFMISAIILFFLLQIQVSAITFPESPELKAQFEEAKLANDTVGMARAWFKVGAALSDSSLFNESNVALREALRLVSEVKNHALMGKVQNYIAINLGDMGKRDESIEMSFEAFYNFMQAGDSTLAANVKINIGMDLVNQGDYEQALKTELEALDLRLQCGDSTNLATYYQHIGEVYKELGIRDKWKSSLETARRLSANPQYANFITQISILNDYGGILEAEEQYAEAVKVYTEMYERSKNEGYSRGMATALSNLSPVYRNLGENSKALECVKEALQIHRNNENTYGQICTNNQLGRVLLAMRQTSEAQKSFEEGLRLATSHNYVAEQKESFDGLYNVAKQKGQWKDALLYHEQWSELEDSLQNINLQEKLAELETRYQTEKKEQQIELLNQENELKNSSLKFQRFAIWTGSLVVIVVSILTFLLVRQRRKRQALKQNELEQKLLRSQMNPHFIFNSLGAIQNFMMKNDGRRAAFYLSSFSSLMRSILKNSREEMISLQEEKQTLENYLTLHQLRLGEKLSFSVTIDNDLEQEEIMLPPMLVQPFVENAVIHGVEKMEGKVNVSVEFKKEDKQLLIIVKDNGKGINLEEDGSQKGHVSYALQIFKERIANLKKTNRTSVSFEIGKANHEEEMNPGTIVKVRFTLKND